MNVPVSHDELKKLRAARSSFSGRVFRRSLSPVWLLVAAVVAVALILGVDHLRGGSIPDGYAVALATFAVGVSAWHDGAIVCCACAIFGILPSANNRSLTRLSS